MHLVRALLLAKVPLAVSAAIEMDCQTHPSAEGSSSRRMSLALYHPPRNARRSTAASPGGRTKGLPGILAQSLPSAPASGSSRMSRRLRPHRRCQARRTSETKDRSPAAPSTTARDGSNKATAALLPATAAPAQSKGCRLPYAALQTGHRAPKAPGSPNRGSPEANDPKERDPPDRHRKPEIPLINAAHRTHPMRSGCPDRIRIQNQKPESFSTAC